MKTRSNFARRAMTVAFGVGAALAVGIAFAVWTQTGTGSGEAKASNAQASVVTAGTSTADLYPGFNGGDLYLQVTNPNPYPVTFTSMTAGSVTSSDTTACPNVNVTATGKTGLSITVPANTNTANAVSATITDVVSMIKAAPDGCQNKTFTVGVTLDGTQQ